ncbi:MAG: MFS transporter [bacterium]
MEAPEEAPMEEGPRSSLLGDPNLYVIFSVTLTAVLGVSSITPALPKVMRALDTGPGSIGLLITAFTLPGLVLTPLLGVLADRFGRRVVLVPSLLLFALAGTACAFARDFSLLVGLRFVQGMGAASLGSLNVTLIGDLYEGTRRAAAMGYNASVLSVGTASYPAIGGALATLAWFYPFALPALTLPAALLVLFGLDNPEPESEQTLKEYLERVVEILRDRRVVGILTATVVTFVLLYGSYLTYFPLLMDASFGLSSLYIGLILSSMSLTTALTSAQIGRLALHFRPPVMVAWGFGLYGAGLLVMALVPVAWMLLLPAVLFGVGHGLNFPNLQTLLAELAPLEYRGAFFSVNGLALRGGQTAGPLVMGLLYAAAGSGAPFYGGAILALIMVPAALFLLGTIRPDG